MTDNTDRLSELATVTIAASGTTSDIAYVPHGHVLCGIMMPSAWTAADITLSVSYDKGTTFQTLIDAAGSNITVASPAASKNIGLVPAQLYGIDQVKIVASVAQDSARTIKLKFVKLVGA